MLNIIMFANEAASTLAADFLIGDTVLQLASGTGASFPSPDNTIGEFFSLTLVDALTGTRKEIVYCTSRSSDLCTVMRAQEGTSEQDWLIGDVAANLVTKGAFDVLNQQISNLDILTTTQLGCVGDNSTDNYSVLNTRLNALPEGTTVYVDGYVRFNTALVITNRINLICRSYTDALVPDVGVSDDGLTFQGDASGLNCIDLKLNVYGNASACKSAVVLNRVDRSPNIDLNIYCGASDYGLELIGCLINKVNLNSSVNFTPPTSFASPDFQNDHFYINKNLVHGVATNANVIWHNLEGGRNGFLCESQGGEGDNQIYGTTEGLTGRANNFNACENLHIHDQHLESNTDDDLIFNCSGARIQNVFNTGKMIINESYGTVIDSYYGKLSVDGLSVATRIGNIKVTSSAQLTDADRGYRRTTETFGVIRSTLNIDTFYGATGSYTLENLNANVFMDIWTDGTTPDGCTLVGSGAVTRNTSTTYDDARGVSALINVTNTTLTNGFYMTPTYYPAATQDDSVSAMIPLFVPAGQSDLIVWGLSDGQFLDFGRVTSRDTWVPVRGGVTVVDGQAIQFIIRPWNFTTNLPATGSFYVGGFCPVRGLRSPAHLCDSGRRGEYIVSSVANAPAYLGQRAVVGTTCYMAVGTATNADWKALN